MTYEAQGHHKEEAKAEESCKAEIGNCRPREDSASDRLGKIGNPEGTNCRRYGAQNAGLILRGSRSRVV